MCESIKQQGASLTAVLMAALIFFSSCSSTTLISSEPSGAAVYLNGEKVGKTPYSHTDTKIVGSCTQLRLEEEGYEVFNAVFCRNEQVDAGAIIGGLFFFPVFLWVMAYKPGRTYELIPLDGVEPEPDFDDSKKEKLRELKEMFEEGLINKEEYDAERKKILEGA